jgi:DNA polymerase I-like protein with 3'-5' exonuclease and polymerase domains
MHKSRGVRPDPPKRPIRVVRTWDEAVALNTELMACKRIIAFDTEWHSFDDSRHPVNNGLAFCVTLCWQARDGELERVYLHNYGESEGNIFALREWFESEEHIKAGHNVPVDWHIVQNHGIDIKGAKIDTMVLDYMQDENRLPEKGSGHDLKTCASDFLGRERKDFAHTFGTKRLKKDGTPYASGALDVPSLIVYVSIPDSITGEIIQCPSYEEAVEGAAQEALEEAETRPYTRWLTLFGYAVADAHDTLELLHLVYRPEMQAIQWSRDKTYWDYYYQYETAITEIICIMERRGMFLDIEMLEEMEQVAQEELDRLEGSIIQWAGCPLKISSGKQLAQLLHGEGAQPVMWKASKKKIDFYIHGMGLPIVRETPTGQPGTGAEDLKKLRKTLATMPEYDSVDLSGLDALIRHAKADWHRGNLTKIRESSLESRIRCRINQIGTTSGRFSTANPVNLQNVTTGEKDLFHLRDAFCAPPGMVLVVADFSQLEYRLLAHFTQEPKLIQLFWEGWDLHSLTTYNVFPKCKEATDKQFGGFTTEAGAWVAEHFSDVRKFAKILNFEIIYGVGHRKLAEQLGLKEEEAKRMIDGWFSGYPCVKAWQKRELELARQRGYGRTLAGRFRHPDLYALNHDCKVGCRHRLRDDNGNDLGRRCGIRGAEERTFLNALIQGSAADMAKRAMILVHKNERLHELGYEMVMQVHDEILGYCPLGAQEEVMKIVKQIMENPFSKPLRVPMPVSIGAGPTWASAKV